jgi:hypothetical protein
MGALGGMRELLRTTAGEGGPSGGTDRAAYASPAPRPPFKSLGGPADYPGKPEGGVG